VEELDLEVVEDLTVDSTTRARGRQGAGARARGRELERVDNGSRDGGRAAARGTAPEARGRLGGARARTCRRLNSWSSGGGGIRHREAEVGGQDRGGGEGRRGTAGGGQDKGDL
jgi:hypothetical protein